MVTPKTGQPRGRPPDPDKVAALIDAGWELFLTHGVQAVAIEAIAEKASVSKATLYKYFPDKASLFEACVLREMERIEAAQRHGPEVRPLEETLRHFGLGIMGFIVSDSAVDFYNTLSGELRRHAALARGFYDRGPGRTRANLAAILAKADRDGELVVDDPQQAAEDLFGLWQGFSNFQLSLNIDTALIRKTVRARIDHGISIFLKAYRAPPASRASLQR